MELEELIEDIRDFKKNTESILYLTKGTDMYQRALYDLIEFKLNKIDAQLHKLKESNEAEYQKIVEKVLPIFIKLLKTDYYTENYPFGSLIIEAHLENINPPSEIEIKRHIQRVSFLNETGVIDFLINKYPELGKNNSNFTYFLMQFLDIQYGTLQPIVNALRSGQIKNKNYPKPNQLVHSIIEKYIK
jgi:hypothetical protein